MRQAVIGVPLSWDAYGMYPLDTDEPLTKAGRQIVEDIKQAERGRAEKLARYRLAVDRSDLIPAWTLVQIVRAKGTALDEYEHRVKPFLGDGSSVSVALYRYGIIALAFRHYTETSWPSRAAYESLNREMKSVREQLRSVSTRRLGVAISLVRDAPMWDLEHRALLEDYQRSHPRGIDARPLLCRAYLTGMVSAWSQ